MTTTSARSGDRAPDVIGARAVERLLDAYRGDRRSRLAHRHPARPRSRSATPRASALARQAPRRSDGDVGDRGASRCCASCSTPAGSDRRRRSARPAARHRARSVVATGGSGLAAFEALDDAPDGRARRRGRCAGPDDGSRRDGRTAGATRQAVTSPGATPRRPAARRAVRAARGAARPRRRSAPLPDAKLVDAPGRASSAPGGRRRGSGWRCAAPSTRRSPCAAAASRSTTCARAFEASRRRRCRSSFLAAVQHRRATSRASSRWPRRCRGAHRDDERWRQQLAQAFHAIVTAREAHRAGSAVRASGSRRRWPAFARLSSATQIAASRRRPESGADR